MLGFVTFGTPEQIQRAGEFVEKQGVTCAILKAKDGRTELMVLFNKTISEIAAFNLFKRVDDGEFGTKDTSYILVPASNAKTR